MSADMVANPHHALAINMGKQAAFVTLQVKMPIAAVTLANILIHHAFAAIAAETAHLAILQKLVHIAVYSAFANAAILYRIHNFGNGKLAVVMAF